MVKDDFSVPQLILDKFLISDIANLQVYPLENRSKVLAFTCT